MNVSALAAWCALGAACGGERSGGEVLDERPGLAAELVALTLATDATQPMAWVITVGAEGRSIELGEGPAYFRVPASSGEAKGRVAEAPFVLAPGETRALAPRLLLWAPGVTEAVIGIGARSDGLDFGGELALGAGTPMTVEVRRGLLTLRIATHSGVALDAGMRLGLTLDGALASNDLAERVSGPIALKHYAGARRWLLRPDCDSDEACAEGGASFPCVERCACVCDDGGCDCGFAGLEGAMESEALADARRVVGADAAEAALERVRLHWVFKRSLGGTSSCDVHGELAVSPETYGRFFARATEAAVAINQRLGYRLIDILSPMNEANHPLQDGAHRNAAGQPTLGGFLSFVDLIRQSSCGDAGCCAASRYIVADPDVPALSAAALAAAQTVLEEADPALAPEVALSLYLDTEQRDPLQLAADGAPASIVTPVGDFMSELVAALDGRAWPHALIVVDTYPGSWGAPWFESDDGIVHHMDLATRRIVRVDPIAAADAAVARALAAADDVAAVVGARPTVVLGEVGWSTFDGDEDAQATFARRLFDAAGAASMHDPAFGGLLWFKSRDRVAFAYPSWDVAASPLDGSEVSCDAGGLGRIVCAAALFQQMEGQWGLVRADGTRKPAWEALIGRWAVGRGQ